MNIKTLYGNLKRHKLISAINIFGLVIGILSVLFILEYVCFERSYDSFHKNADHLYRVGYKRFNNNQLQWETANSYYPIGRWLKENYPEVVNCANIRRFYNISVTYENEQGNKVAYYEPKSYYATNSLFKLFDIPLVQGSKDCLKAPNTVAISENMAQKYFGNENPVGKFITVNNRGKYTVTAVFEPIPRNSHIQTDFLFSLETVLAMRPKLNNLWGGDDLFHTYIQLKPGIDIEGFKQRAFPDMIASNYKEKLERNNQRDEFFMQSVPDIHLYSDIDFETEPPGSATNISILYGFAILLLVIAWINYVNLVTAQSVERAKEIGIKKTSGAGRASIARQFIAEAFVFNLFCLTIALMAFVLINPFFKHIANIEETFNPFASSGFLKLLLIAFPLGVWASSIYPAFVLSSMNPVKVLKGKFKNSGQAMVFRKSLVTVQFVISLGLMIGTLVTYYQTSFLMKKDMGLNYHSSLVVRFPQTKESLDARMNKFKIIENKIKALPEVAEYTLTSDAPGDQVNHWLSLGRQGHSKKDIKWYDQIIADDRFMDFYDVKLLAGRAFHKDETSNQQTIILNDLAAKRLGYTNPEDAINQVMVSNRNQQFKVIGVVEDFHFISVKTAPKPFVITIDDRSKQFVTLKLHESARDNYAALIPKLRAIYSKVFPGQPFDYFSLDDKMRMHLKQDRTFVGVFSGFSFLAILIAVIGIMGLILININQNMKELGVRKVLGAELTDITRLLSKQLSVQFVIALIIAIPISYYGFEYEFLSSYIHRIDMNIWFFAIPVIILTAIIFTVILVISKMVFRMKLSTVLKYE